jgi:NADPH2:quinone reductase
MLGAKVIATGSNSEKLKFAKEVGADHIINLSEDKKWWETVKELTDGEGVDAVYDPVGLVDISMKCIKFKGKVLIVGFAGGKWEDVAMNRVLLKNVSLVGLHINLYTKLDPETYKNCWNHLFELFSTNKLKPLVNKRKFKLEEISEVFKLIQDRKSISKLVVTIDDDSGKAKL